LSSSSRDPADLTIGSSLGTVGDDQIARHLEGRLNDHQWKGSRAVDHWISVDFHLLWVELRFIQVHWGGHRWVGIQVDIDFHWVIDGQGGEGLNELTDGGCVGVHLDRWESQVGDKLISWRPWETLKILKSKWLANSRHLRDNRRDFGR